MADNGSQSEQAVFVIGAAGGVGSRLVRRLVEEGHRVSGMHRGNDDAEAITEAGATPVQGDLVEDSAEALAERLAGHDAVVFSAGGGGDVFKVDRDGVVKAVQAAGQAGVRRFALVSVFMDAWRGDESPGEDFEQYMQAKRGADVALAASDLDFLIVRPGTLSDDDGTGQINAGISVAYDKIPRDDVAAFLAAGLFAEGLNRIAVEITAGPLPVDDAVAALQMRPYVA